MSTTTSRAEAQGHLRALGTLLVDEGQLVLTAGASVAQLADAFGADELGDATTLMDWLAARPEVDEIFATDAGFAQALFRTHPASPEIAGSVRPAFRGMVVRAYTLLRWVAVEASLGRRFSAVEVAPPMLYARTERTRELLAEGEPIHLAQASLDPLELGEAGATALDPSELEMIRALALAVEQPSGPLSLRAELQAARVALALTLGDDARVEVRFDSPLDAAALTRALGAAAPRATEA